MSTLKGPSVGLILIVAHVHVEVSLNYCSQNGGNLYRAPYYNRNLNIGPRIDSNLGQSPCRGYHNEVQYAGSSLRV